MELETERRSTATVHVASLRQTERSARWNSLDRKMRVALVVEAAAGGVAVHIADLIRGLRTYRAIDIHLVIPIGDRFDASIIGEDVLALCTSVHRIPMVRSVGPADMVAFAHLFRCLNRIKPDIVHSHSSKAAALSRVCFGPWKQVYTPHAVYTLNPYLQRSERRFYGLVERLLGRFRTHRIIAVSEDEADHLRQSLRIPAGIVATIINGVTKPDLVPRHDARVALGLPTDVFVIGFVGRLEFQKGIDRLLRIVNAMNAKGFTNVIFAVVGPGDFAAAAGAQRNAIPENVHLVGSLPHARRYFSAFDLLALPSRYEGFPYVALEAMAANVPVISTRVSGVAELIEIEEIGIVVPNEDDTRQFEEAAAALVKDDIKRRRMRGNCALAVERFSADQMVKKTVDLYRILLLEEFA
ncbi:glycosyltransferase family 4 protein [Paraburkholderia jirisanensis]